VVMSNGAAARSLLAFSDPSLWEEQPVNMLRLLFHPLGLRRFIVNWSDVSAHMLRRAHRELGAIGDDRRAQALLAELHAFPGLPERPPAPTPPGVGDLVLPVHLRKDGVDVRVFSAIMSLGTPQDVTLQELHIETFFPADAASDAVLRAMAGGGAPGGGPS
jgi:hypothetical protein